jgi:AraC-like DNA-binding protein
MRVTIFDVHPALNQIVESIIYFERHATETGEFAQTCMPSHECFLSFENNTDFKVKSDHSKEYFLMHETSIISPQLNKTYLSGTYMQSLTVKFKNNGFYRMFKIPIVQLKNSCFNAKDVLDKDFSVVNEIILNTENVLEKVNIVQNFLLKKLQNVSHFSSFNYAVEQSVLYNNINVNQLAENACIGVRQLQRKFMEHFGLSPKHYLKLARFSNSYRIKIKYPHLNWGEIALRCGYYDQMHLIHDFKSIASINPNQFFKDLESSILLFPGEVRLD